jgi:hypothetical protein
MALSLGITDRAHRRHDAHLLAAFANATSMDKIEAVTGV